MDGAVLSDQSFLLRFFPDPGERGRSRDERLLVVNLGPELPLDVAPEPLLAPPTGCQWRPVLSTEDQRYGGSGAPEPTVDAGWRLPAECALVFDTEPREGPA